MAIETLGMALRQLRGLFAEGTVAGLSDCAAPGAVPEPRGRRGL